MEKWQQRVVDEKKELDEKRSKLETYLDENKDELLEEQLMYMENYSAVLSKRISLFPKRAVNWCMCTELKGVARDGKSTCSICGGIDAYGKSKDRPDKFKKVL